ncbi:Rha family transcriptional regulator [Sporomusa acidovorans]|uniref:Phage regulatory protein Rha n=1 Tax=Sporomusa acidovorans (strain ATCC 49682 / DSM 3132 / Mol) TaxID=1123286 RepID=A0ABZ3J7F2_SPOA4|nr:Rha family transcriptional regulator [Sporomusa acidovorans]OZC24194.1 phage regulatory protein Rha [Sporomusa acidovorans DSM 3132]SDF77558.1 phage regulatory protein, rha family [Sporomusa acidovorans]
MNQLVQVNNGQVVVSSRQVADNFGKNHRDVLESVREILRSAGNSATPMFYETIYEHPQNKQQYPEYLMNRDGFTLLAMGFTGSEAMQWKIKYIQAFNEMEKQLNVPVTNNNFNQIYKIIRALSSAPKANLPYVVKAVELQYPGIFDGIEQPNDNQKIKHCNHPTDNSAVRTTILKFLDENNVLGIATNQAYADYLDFCKTERLNPTNNIHFSRQVTSILDIQVASKKINGKKYRMFISK